MARKDIRSAVRSASRNDAPSPSQSRFARAEATLAVRPTGYIETPDAPSHEVAASIVDQVSSPLAAVVEPRLDAQLTPPALPPALHEEARVSAQLVAKLTSRLGTPRHEVWPLDLIDDNPYNARTIYLPEKIAELSQSMQADGQFVPGIAVARGDRRTLIGGHYRKRAARHGGIAGLSIMVYDNVSDKDLYLISYKENNEHNPQSALDNAHAWRRLLDEQVYSSEVEIAEAIGQSKSNVNKTLAILKLDQEALEIIEQKPLAFALGTLYELTLLQKVGGPSATISMAQRILDESLGRKDVEQERMRLEERAAAGPVRRRKNETSRPYRLWSHGTAIGQIREWDTGKVTVEVEFGDKADERIQFINELRARFQGADKPPVDGDTTPASGE